MFRAAELRTQRCAGGTDCLMKHYRWAYFTR
jgi:hypothetical protein